MDKLGTVEITLSESVIRLIRELNGICEPEPTPKKCKLYLKITLYTNNKYDAYFVDSSIHQLFKLKPDSVIALSVPVQRYCSKYFFQSEAFDINCLYRTSAGVTYRCTKINDDEIELTEV